jgi:hypothetical protein
MAQKVQVLLVCDLHDDDTEGTETVGFALDGAAYEIDVCDSHAAQLRDAFAPFVGAARRAGRAAAGRSVGSGRRSTRGSKAATKDRTTEIREWARTHGHTVSERGRLSAAVVAAYDAAH